MVLFIYNARRYSSEFKIFHKQNVSFFNVIFQKILRIVYFLEQLFSMAIASSDKHRKLPIQ
jgi:hypothetical protein